MSNGKKCVRAKLVKEVFTIKENRSFPLLYWQETRECEEFWDHEIKRLQSLRKIFGENSLSFPRFNKDGKIEVFLSQWKAFSDARLDVSEALKFALKYGYGRWWTLDDVQLFVEEQKGPILEAAMGALKYKFINGEWVATEDKFCPSGEKPIVFSDDIEIGKTVAVPNSEIELERTYRLQVGSNGMIYIEAQVNPFNQDLSAVGGAMFAKAHIAMRQNGFIIRAFNVRIGSEEYVLLKAQKEDGEEFEAVWPSISTKEIIFSLADQVAAAMGDSF